jgi:hypothetical protein
LSTVLGSDSERARAVAVAAVHRQRRQHRSAKTEERLGGGLAHLAALDRLKDLLQLSTEEDRDDRRRRLVGAQAVILPSGRDRRPQQPLVLVDRLDHGRAEEQEL